MTGARSTGSTSRRAIDSATDHQRRQQDRSPQKVQPRVPRRRRRQVHHWSAVILGDKGDGSAKARAAAKAQYMWANADHVPDIIEKHTAHNGNHVLYESKVYTPLQTSDNLGNGTARGGGS
eukprot:2737507-Prymnesium_polylepis.1